MKELIACCGLDCEACDARIATLTNDDALRAATAAKWSEMNNGPMTAEMINCVGCRTDGPKFGYCAMCGIRACATAKGFATCGECGELDTCAAVKPILENDPHARNNLRMQA